MFEAHGGPGKTRDAVCKLCACCVHAVCVVRVRVRVRVVLALLQSYND
jgi:hypothetical protein